MPPLGPKVSSVDTFSRTMEFTLDQLTNIESLKQITYDYCNEFLKIFENYNLSQSNAEVAMNEHSVVKGIEEVFRVPPRP